MRGAGERPGGGRESAIRAIANAGIRVTSIRDYDADPAQWLPSAEAPESVEIFDFTILILDLVFEIGHTSDGKPKSKSKV